MPTAHMTRAMQPEQREGTHLRRALWLTAVLTLLVLARTWAVAEPQLGSEAIAAPAQRLTPTDAPRFAAGRWVDAQGRPLAPEVAP